VSENSKRTLQNGRIGPLRDCPQAPEHGTTIMLSCPGRQEVLEAPAQALTFWKWAPSALPQAQRPDNARFRVFRPRVFAIFTQNRRVKSPIHQK